MARMTKVIAAFAAVVTMALAAFAFTTPKAQAWYGGMYAPYYGAAYSPFYGGYAPYYGGYYGGALYNPISQWIVLSGLFNPSFGGLY